MKIRTTAMALLLAGVLPLAAGCAATTASSSTGASSSASASASASTATTEEGTDTSAPTGARPAGGGPGSSVDVSSVTTEEQLIALIQDAYGDGGLDLHRGHQPVQDVLDAVLAISHDELHVRMEEQGQNLAAVATDLGIDPQTLIDALVESRSSAIDTLLENGTITQEEADGYLAALEAAFEFRVNWDGSEATPTFSGLEA